MDYERLMQPGQFLDLLSPRPAWHADAACRGMGTATFYLELGDTTAAAADICATCTVRSECADAGAGERYGIWAGQSARQRRRPAA